MHRHASVNRIYRLVWSHASSSWVPAAETSRGRKKGSSKTLLATALSLAAGLAEAAPLGGQVVGGSGHIGQSGTLTTITQSSPTLSLSWASFNIAPQETVNFLQPSASAIAVNRITGSNGTQILGHLQANGQVYLINPNGIVFGRGAQVDVGGLVASTLDVDSASLQSAARTFSGTASGSVINQGTINASGNGSGGGYVALLGTHVANQGTISAQLGTVALGAGSAATLTFQGDSLVHLQVDRSVLNSVAANGGLIRADGGRVLMSAGAKDTLLASVVNNTGVIEARAVEDHAGTITLLGGMAAGTVNVAGTLDASAPHGGSGGLIETSAANVEVADSAKITTAAAAGLTGSWLIDPHDFTVAASGGNITGATLSGQLATTNETLQSSSGTASGSGNVTINDPVSWSADTSLTLIASNNVNVNASVTASGNHAGVVINPNTGNASDAASGVGTLTFSHGAAINLSGTSATASVAGVSYIIVNTLGVAADATTPPLTPSLQGMAAPANKSKNYALGGNIDAAATSAWNSGAGFTPIGNASTPFQGSFTGLGHTINNLFIYLPSTNDVGLFGFAGFLSTPTYVPTIQNVGLVGGSVTGSGNVGALVGQSEDNIYNSFATATVTGTTNVGGLVGEFGGKFNNVSLNNSYATGAVVGTTSVGGLIGESGGYPASTTLDNAYATGNVSGTSGVGGLVGSQSDSSINSSYATGNVSAGSGGSNVGGLVGSQSDSYINSNYATGNVSAGSGGSNVGGLIGNSAAGNYGSSINNSYATGNVSVASYGSNVGGLAGINIGTNYGGYGNPAPSAITNSYATGKVNAGSVGSNVGGLVGYNTTSGSISNSYATGNVTGSASTIGGLVGANNYGVISNGYWNSTTSGQANSAQSSGNQSAVGGLTTSQMRIATNFAGFGFSTVPGASGNSWVMVDADGTLNNAGSALGAAFPMLTSEYSTAIGNAHQLQLMAMALGASYTLAANVDASATALAVANGSGDVWSTAGGFVPTGRSSAPFTGTFNGLGYTISNLNIYLRSVDNVGLFGVANSTSAIRNVGLIGGGITGNNNVGALAGQDAGSIDNSYATAAVTAPVSTNTYRAGGLVGLGQGAISNSYATGAVTGSADVGGLIGESYGPISNSYATGTVSGNVGLGPTGGLVAINHSTITNSHAAGAVYGQNSVGGLVGMNVSGGSISNSYAAGTVTGDADVGGLVGSNDGSIGNSYATGSVFSGGGYGGGSAGGLVGSNSGTISNSYAAGRVSGGGYGGLAGGLVGSNSGTVSNSFWDTTTSGLTTSAGGTGMVTSNMKLQTNFTSATAANGNVNPGWDFAGTWAITGQSYPLLIGVNLTPLTITAVNVNKIYDGSAFSGDSNGVTYSIPGAASNFFGSVTYTGTSQGVIDVAGGTFTITPGGLQQTTNQYFVTYVSGTLTMSKLALSGTIAVGSSIYGATLTPGTVTLTTPIFGDVVGAGTVIVTTTNQTSTSGHLTAGTHLGIESVGSTLTGVDAGNYTFAGAFGDYTVTPLTLTGAIATGSSIYGSVLTPGAVTLTTPIVGDVVTAGAVTVTTTNQTSTSGHLTAGTHAGSESVGSTLSGADAANYSFAGTTGDYTVSQLTLTGAIAAGSSIYGSALTPGAVTLATPIVGDVVTAGAVTVTTTNQTSTSGHLTAGTHAGSESVGSTLTGADATNYNFAGAIGDYTVTPLAISVAATGVNKTYDGTTSAAPTLSSAGVILRDQVAFADTAANFASKNAGSGQTVAVSGITMGGADAADYVLDGTTAMTAATISPASLTVSGIAAGNKIYDGNTTAVLTGGSLAGVMAGDAGSVTLINSGSFATKNVGTGIVVATAQTLSGTGAGNYVLVQPIGLVASITPATLTYDAAPASRTAGQPPTGLGGSISGFVAGESQPNDTAGTLAWTTPANAGSGAGQYAIDGGGLTAENYVFVEAAGNAAALTLTPAAVSPHVPAPALPRDAVSAIAALQAMMQVSGAGPPELLDQPAALVAAQFADGGIPGAKGADADSRASAWGVGPLEDTKRRIGTTLGSLRIVNGGVRLPE